MTTSKSKSKKLIERGDFDKAYYKKFYLNPTTRVFDKQGPALLANFVFAYVEYLRLPLKRTLDMGCGLGYWKKELTKHFPKAHYAGVEYSEYLCQKYGWEQGSVIDYGGQGEFDLVICQSVLQYLNDKDFKKALANLHRLCRGVLYLEIITQKDWELHCDQKSTDGRIFLRGAAWYQKHLGKYFRNLGGGLYLSKKTSTVLYELEVG